MRFLRSPIIYFLLTGILAFTLLFWHTKPLDYNILIVGAIVLILTLLTYLMIYNFFGGDNYIFLISSMLVIFGIVMIYRLEPSFGMLQIGWYVLGILAFISSFSLTKYLEFWKKIKIIYFILIIGLFIATLMLGSSIFGATNWITINGFSVQPLEIIKILFVFFLACYYSKPKDNLIFNFKEKYIMMACVYLFCAFLILQREWGTILLLLFTYLAMLFVYEKDRRLMVFNIIGISLISLIGATFMNHIKVRIATWRDPWEHATSFSYQVAQSLFAISSGDFFGKGIGAGMPNLIPVALSDFIFAAICEEMGIFGGAAVILMFFLIIYRGFKLALSLTDEFDKCVVVGLTLLLGFQAFIIMGGVINFIPLTGITLPFVSYGGSSLVISFILIGMLQGLSAKGGKA